MQRSVKDNSQERQIEALAQEIETLKQQQIVNPENFKFPMPYSPFAGDGEIPARYWERATNLATFQSADICLCAAVAHKHTSSHRTIKSISYPENH